MAEFRYDNEGWTGGGMNSLDNCTEIRVPKRGTGYETFTPAGVKFIQGVDTITTTDPKCMRVLRADRRFTEIV